MPNPLPAGPYRVLQSVEGQPLPYYVIPFDADGQCEGPQTREHLLQAAAGYTDIFLFSHGWNNDWSAATERYEGFINGVQELRRTYHLPVPANYKPLLVGVFWPSQAMAWFDSETGPGFAAADPAAQDRAATLSNEVLRSIAAALAPADRPRFYALAQADTLAPEQARELAALLAGIAKADAEGDREGAPSALDLLAAATSLETPEPDYDDVGTAGDSSAGPRAAFGFGDLLSALDPRNLIKPFTVWQMKDRAGQVGHQGVAPLLVDLLQRSAARVHLLGHSYGCKVVMTALCTPPSLPRPVESALLLQPAVSQYALATQVPGRDAGVAGGFARALQQRVVQPIMATYSSHDAALTKLFHLSVRRSDDLGELQFAAEGGTPSKYGAMGGFGMQSSQASFVPIQDPGGDYGLRSGKRLFAVDGTRTISGHGDISSPSTWWLSYQLASAHQQGG